MRSASRRNGRSRVPIHWILVAGPALFLLVFFVLPNALLLSASFLKSEAQVLTNEFTLRNYTFFFSSPIYPWALARSFVIGLGVGIGVVVLGFPIAYFVTRSRSRWRGLLIALCLTPLLASVVVRTYGWVIIFNRFGVLNDILLGLGLIDQRISFIPSTPAIIIGLTHALLPYGVLTCMGSLAGLSPSLERAAMSLGANRLNTFLHVVLPLCLPGIAGGFVLAFSISISAYATPAILGGPQTETIATLLYLFINQILDWSLASMLGVLLVVSTAAILYVAARQGAKWAAL